jgi:hypothetical protein
VRSIELSKSPEPRAAILQRLLASPGPELACEQCFEEIDRYVELEIAADEAIPGTRAHLDGCAACSEEHLSLRALIQSEA